MSEEEKNENHSLLKHIKKLEKRVKELESNKQNNWDKVKIFAPIISSILVALIGIWAMHSITGAVEKQRLELSHLTAMRDLLVKISSPEIQKAEAEATGVLLGAFGSWAVSPLIHELGKPGEVRALAAREGLRVAAFKDPAATCELLISVLASRRGLFTWQTHLEVIKLLGEIGCSEALDILHEYKMLLSSEEGVNEYLAMLRLEPKPNIKALNKMLAEVEHSLNRIEK
jgi:hypothetical protein